MENPVGGSAAPTASPSSETQPARLTLEELLNASLRGEIGPVEVTYTSDGAVRIVDWLDRIGYVDSEGFVAWMGLRHRSACPTCGRPR